MGQPRRRSRACPIPARGSAARRTRSATPATAASDRSSRSPSRCSGIASRRRTRSCPAPGAAHGPDGSQPSRGTWSVRPELDGNTVTDAWCVGTMYRGFEQILQGRDPSDALVIAPRICGICSTPALRRSLGARDRVRRADRPQRDAHPQPLPDGRVGDERRAPHLPDVRARLLQRGLSRPPHVRPGRRAFEPPFKGCIAAETVEATKRVLGIVIAFGGQWPHSTYMMSGGVTCALDASEAGRVRGGDRRLRRVVRARDPRLQLRRVARGWRAPMTSKVDEAPAHR